MNKLILILMFSMFSTTSFSNKNNSKNDIAFVLGLISQPVIVVNGFEPYKDFLLHYECSDIDVMKIFMGKIENIEGVDSSDVSLKEYTDANVIKSKSVKLLINEYIVESEISNTYGISDQIIEKGAKFGLVNPYKLDREQKENFLLGVILSNYRLNNRKIGRHSSGKYVIDIERSEEYFDLLATMMEKEFDTSVTYVLSNSKYLKNRAVIFMGSIEFSLNGDMKDNFEALLTNKTNKECKTH